MVKEEILDGGNCVAILNIYVTFELEQQVSIVCHNPSI
jgi:hypothetical protein